MIADQTECRRTGVPGMGDSKLVVVRVMYDIDGA